MTQLSALQIDRVVGVLIGAACADALGAGYEFGSAPLIGPPAMIGGGLGNFAPGEWTDDTAQTYAIARVAAAGADFRSAKALDEVAAGFAEWFASGPPDVGNQTRAILSAVRHNPTAAAMSAAAQSLHERTGRSGGNGSLMRTSPVALCYLADGQEAALVEAAMKVSALTHYDLHAQEACALWCLAIRNTVLSGEITDPRRGLTWLPESRRDFWLERIAEAEQRNPNSFRPNGYVVTAFQAAWSAIWHTPVPVDAPGTGQVAAQHLVDALGTAIAIGDDTDTVATIAGALLGARWGASAVPESWLEILHGWPGAKAADLVQLAHQTIQS